MIRINKYLSEAGYCSRREADRLIEAKRVKLNDSLAEMGSKVSETDKVYVDDKLIEGTNEFVYMLFNKPVGITCTTDKSIRGNIVDYINYHKRIFHVGRLDKSSEGLIIMTNDGDIVNKILRSRNDHEKEYIVKVHKPLTDKFIKDMSTGVPILDQLTKKCVVEQLSTDTFRIILTQGLNRQIRRMCEYFNYEVVGLQRVRIMNLKLDVPVGNWRYLTKLEFAELTTLTDLSHKTHN